MVGYSAPIKARVIAKLIFTALNLFSNKADRIPLHFTDTEAEARAWIDARRRDLAAARVLDDVGGELRDHDRHLAGAPRLDAVLARQAPRLVAGDRHVAPLVDGEDARGGRPCGDGRRRGGLGAVGAVGARGGRGRGGRELHDSPSARRPG